MAAQTHNKIEDYFDKQFQFGKKINQEDREHTRPKIKKSNSNRTKINSNQKGVHYV